MASYSKRRRRQRHQLTAQQKANRAATARPPISYGQNSYRAVRAMQRHRSKGQGTPPREKIVKRPLRELRRKTRANARSLLNRSASYRKIQEFREAARKLRGCSPRPDSRKAGKTKKRGAGSGLKRKFNPTWC